MYLDIPYQYIWTAPGLATCIVLLGSILFIKGSSLPSPIIAAAGNYFYEHTRLITEARKISHAHKGNGRPHAKSHDNGHHHHPAIREVTMQRVLREALEQVRIEFVLPATILSGLLCVVNFSEPVIVGRY